MEYTPGAYEMHSDWAGYMQLPQMLIMLLQHNYTILHVSDDISRAPLLSRSTWTGVCKSSICLILCLILWACGPVQLAFSSVSSVCKCHDVHPTRLLHVVLDIKHCLEAGAGAERSAASTHETQSSLTFLGAHFPCKVWECLSL